MKNLLEVVRGQPVAEKIGYPQYLIGATGEGTVRLRQEPVKPLSLRLLIFLHRSNDILDWILANHGQDPLDLLVVESRPDTGEDGAEMPEPANGRYPFLNRKVWEEAVGAMQGDEDEDEDEGEDEDEDEDEGEEQWLEAESKGEPQASARGGTAGVYSREGTGGVYSREGTTDFCSGGDDCFGRRKYRHLMRRQLT